jgi:hypothetical protein
VIEIEMCFIRREKIEFENTQKDIKIHQSITKVEKIFKIVLNNQLSQYIENNSILIPQQSGFRRNHSCETSLSLVLKQWKELVDQNKVIISVFLDLKSAFEAIDRQILLQIL